MAVTQAYLDLTLVDPASTITHIGLVDDQGDELSGGSYARKSVSWASPASADGGRVIRPTADLTFDVPALANDGKVAGWRGFSASSNGTNYGGGDLTPEPYPNGGQYVLEAAGTGYRHNPAS